MADFGAPKESDTFLFKVTIPSKQNYSVAISEIRDGWGIARVSLKMSVWKEIANVAKRDFNKRLKVAKLPAGHWHVGENLVDQLLGRELCVLAWAAETANKTQLPIICRKWLALSPEDRSWLFATIVAEAGLPDDINRGWRKALFYALSDERGEW